jgi:hypothetical protein
LLDFTEGTGATAWPADAVARPANSRLHDFDPEPADHYGTQPIARECRGIHVKACGATGFAVFTLAFRTNSMPRVCLPADSSSEMNSCSGLMPEVVVVQLAVFDEQRLPAEREPWAKITSHR